MAPVLSREISEHSPTSRLAIEIGSALLAAGYHQQVPVRPGFLNLFLYFDGERRALAETRRDSGGARTRLEDPRGRGRAARDHRSRELQPGGPAAPARPGRAASHRRLHRRAGGDRVPRPDRPLVRALRHSAAGAAAAAQPDPGRAVAGARPRVRGTEAHRSRGGPGGPRLALGPRGLPGRRGGLRPRARGPRARADGGRRSGSGRSIPPCARPPTAHGAGPSTRSKPCTRSRSAP